MPSLRVLDLFTRFLSSSGTRSMQTRPARPVTAPPLNAPPAMGSRLIPATTPPHGGSAAGLARSGQNHAATRLGVAPPPQRFPTTQAGVPTPIVPKPDASSRTLWLVIGALLAIAAGVGLALVLTGAL